MNNLDFYSLIEPILGLNEASFKLYDIYLKNIKSMKFATNKALDFGCGNGKFASLLSKNFDVMGLDKSDLMLEKTASLGIAVTKEFDNSMKFSLITAVNDVINYMNADELSEFFDNCYNHLESGGVLMFDVNTYFGFDVIAQGVLHESVDDDTLIIDAKFQNNILKTDMIYFQKENDKFIKSNESITQYYHDNQFFKNQKLNLIKEQQIKLYSDSRSDKILYIYKKG